MGSNIISGWTDQRVDLLRKLWQAGLSASQIAAKLRGVTRNAVIGKASRMGLSGVTGVYRAKPSRPNHSAPKMRPSAPRRFAEPTKIRSKDSGLSELYENACKPLVVNPTGLSAVNNALAPRTPELDANAAQAPRVELRLEAFAPLPGIQPIPFIDRNWPHCAWPVGGEGAEMLCCGAQRDGEGPYCKAHRQRATQAVRPGSPRNGNELARSLRRYA